MKINKIILFLLSITLFISCNKDNIEGSEIENVSLDKGSMVVAIPGVKKVATYAYQGGEQNFNEMMVNDIHVYIFDNSNQTLIYTVKVSSFGSDVAKFPLYTAGTDQQGSVTSGTQVTTVYVANYSVPVEQFTVGSTTLSQFRSLTLPAITDNLSSPFVMYGEDNSVVIGSNNAVTPSQVRLVRLAARIDITNILGSTLTINSAQIVNTPTTSCLSPDGTPASTYSTFSAITNVGYNTSLGLVGDENYMQNMWSHLYTYANNNSGATKTQVTVNYTFRGAAKSTTVDFLQADGTTPLAIDRNYRYQIVISESVLGTPQLDLSVAPWEDGGDIDPSDVGSTPFVVNTPPTSDGTTIIPFANPTTGGNINASALGQLLDFDYSSTSPVTFSITGGSWLHGENSEVTTYTTYAATGGYKGSILVYLPNNASGSVRNATLQIKNNTEIKTYYISQQSSSISVTANRSSANSFIVAPGSGSVVFGVDMANADGITRINSNDIVGAYLLWTDSPQGMAAGAPVKDVRTYNAGSSTLIEVIPGSGQGNAVIAAYNFTTGKVVWSWHIWVTDYNPNTASVGGSDGVFTATNGKVFRYSSTTGTTTTQEGGAHVFMDRNFGAANSTPGDIGSSGLLYMWGRKDPFPGAGNWVKQNTTAKQIYNSKGNVYVTPLVNVNMTPNGGNPNNLEFAISNPSTWIVTYPATNIGYDWYTSVDDLSAQNNTLWGYNGTMTYAKSAYDPCPEGWRVPKSGVWGGLTRTSGNQRAIPWSEQYHGRFGVGSDVTPTDLVDPADSNPGSSATIGYWPATGYRNYNGAIVNNAVTGYYWTSVSSNTTPYYAWAWRFSLGENGQSTNQSRGNGFPIRCMKDN